MTVATAGSLLKEAREARGLSLEEVAAATRVRVPYLEALEENEVHRLPAPVYARGYLRTYASLLELEPEPLIAALRPANREPERTVIAREPQLPRWRPALSPGLLLLAVLALLGGSFVIYARHELNSVKPPPSRLPAVLIARQPVVAPPTHATPPAAAAPATPVPAGPPDPNTRSTAAQLGEITVLLRFTDQAWVYVVVDGNPVYGANGKFFSPGETATFTGTDISVTSGKGAATLVSVNGKPQGSLPDGVTTRDYRAQT